MSLKIVIAILLLAHLAVAPAVGFAQEPAAPTPPAPPVADVNPFARTYLSLELARNYPLAFSQNRFEPGPLHPVFGYRYDLDEHWLMGIGAQFKIMTRRDRTQSREIALWTIYHETLYAIRLEHPSYLLVGPKLIYLLPAKVAMLPLQRDDSYVIEIGAGLSVALARVVGDWMLTLRVDRWRGTTTTRLQGLEVALGASHALH